MARKEHSEFSSNIDLIDVLPPGLYEAVFEPKSEGATGADLASGEWIMRCETRTLDDIRAFGGNDVDDDRRFATAARVSEINLALYRTFAQPFVRSFATPQLAEFAQRMHPLRLQYELFSDANPLMAWLGGAADRVREQRRPVAKDNPFLRMQENVSRQIVDALDTWRDVAEKAAERTFMAVYGSQALQAAVGIDPASTMPSRKAARSPLHLQLVQNRIAELRARIPEGGIREAVVRALLYVGMARGSIDERGFEVIRRTRRALKDLPPLSITEFKGLVRDQYFMLLIEPVAAIAAIPSMLPPDRASRAKAVELIKQVVELSGALPPEGSTRLQQIASLFGSDEGPTLAPVLQELRDELSAKLPAPVLSIPLGSQTEGSKT